MNILNKTNINIKPKASSANKKLGKKLATPMLGYSFCILIVVKVKIGINIIHRLINIVLKTFPIFPPNFVYDSERNQNL